MLHHQRSLHEPLPANHNNTEILKYHFTTKITTKCNDCLVVSVQIITQTAAIKAIKQQRKLGVTKR